MKSLPTAADRQRVGGHDHRDVDLVHPLLVRDSRRRLCRFDTPLRDGRRLHRSVRIHRRQRPEDDPVGRPEREQGSLRGVDHTDSRDRRIRTDYRSGHADRNRNRSQIGDYR